MSMDNPRFNAIYHRIIEAKRALIDVDAALDTVSLASLDASQAGYLVRELATLRTVASNVQARSRKQQAKQTNPPLTRV